MTGNRKKSTELSPVFASFESEPSRSGWRKSCPHVTKDASADALRAQCPLQNEEDPGADTAFARLKRDEAVVPSLWWFEIRNIPL